MGVVPPDEGFLEGLRKIADAYETVLIFDEVITGFRLAKGGAQEYYGVNPDLTTLGKIIGGGLPVGAYGGKAEIMNMLAPDGPVYQAGTLSGNPLAMAAGLAMLTTLNESPGIYEEGAVTNIATFHKNITEGNYDNSTVEPSVTSNLVTILGRTAAYKGIPVYWHQLMKDDERLIPNIGGLKD